MADGPLRVAAVPLTAKAYRDYGDVVSTRAGVTPRSANRGTADRFNWLAELENRRPAKAKPNVCLFHCRPQVRRGQASFEARVLERHPTSTQLFVPMGGSEGYLVLVCLGGDDPDLSTFRAFLATSRQGITYRPGVWHHPLVALDGVRDFVCLVWEDGSSGDTKVAKLPRPVLVDASRGAG